MPSDHTTVLILLAATPRRIAAACKSSSSEQLRRKPEPDSWSVNEVLAHLRACADVWGSSIMTMLTQERPTLRYVSPRGWIKKTNYTDLEFTASFHAYTNQRTDLLRMLRILPDEDWLRGAIVKTGTKLREETVLSYAKRLAQHEAGHCEQIERILLQKSQMGELS